MAPVILAQMREAGVRNPYFELFEDASGRLVLGNVTDPEQRKLAMNLLRSERWSSMRLDEQVSLEFCCGLVQAAREWALRDD